MSDQVLNLTVRLLAGKARTVGGVETILARLTAVIEDRKAKLPGGSYTTQLFAGGSERIGAKIMEEAAEVVDAAAGTEAGSREHLIREAADLVYHLLVILALRDARLADVEAELARRFGLSGLDEKASRGEAEPG